MKEKSNKMLKYSEAIDAVVKNDKNSLKPYLGVIGTDTVIGSVAIREIDFRNSAVHLLSLIFKKDIQVVSEDILRRDHEVKLEKENGKK